MTRELLATTGVLVAAVVLLVLAGGAIGSSETDRSTTDQGPEAWRTPLAENGGSHASLSSLLAPTPQVAPASASMPDRCEFLDLPGRDDCHAWDVRLEQDLPEPRELAYGPEGDLLFTAVETRIGFNLTARDPGDGSLVWRYNDTLPNLAPLGRAMALTDDGSTLVVAGAHYVYGPTGDWRTSSLDFLTLALDARTGERLWQDVYHGSQEREMGWKVQIGPSQEQVFVTGSVKEEKKASHETRTGVQTLAYDLATGERSWVQQLFPPDERCRALTSQGMDVNPSDGSILLTAWTYTCDGDDGDVWAASLEAATGAVQWERYYDEISDHMDSSWEITAGPEGELAYVRLTSWGNTPNASLLAVNTNDGSPAWTADFGAGEYSDDVFDQVLSPDGTRVYVTGQVERIHPEVLGGGLITRDLRTEAFDASTGERVWALTYNAELRSDTWGGEERGLGLGVSPDGESLYTTGFGEVPRASPLYRYAHHYDYLTISHDTQTGEPDWVARYDGPESGQDYAAFATVDPITEQVTVSGISDASVDGTTRELATVTYDLQGPRGGLALPGG